MIAASAILGVGTVTVVAVTTSDDGAPVEAGRRAARAAVAPGGPRVGEAAPDFALASLDGDRTVRLSDYRGRPVVVNFWASWCNPCREEFPLLAAARREHRDERVEILGISYRDIPADARRFARSEHARWPLARDDRGVVADAYGVRAIPQSFFVDARGILRARVFGITSADDLEAALRTILPGPTR